LVLALVDENEFYFSRIAARAYRLKESIELLRAADRGTDQ
jgi:hypothetical protein